MREFSRCNWRSNLKWTLAKGEYKRSLVTEFSLLLTCLCGGVRLSKTEWRRKQTQTRTEHRREPPTPSPCFALRFPFSSAAASTPVVVSLARSSDPTPTPPCKSTKSLPLPMFLLPQSAAMTRLTGTPFCVSVLETLLRTVISYGNSSRS